jgi:hypothetical protein
MLRYEGCWAPARLPAACLALKQNLRAVALALMFFMEGGRPYPLDLAADTCGTAVGRQRHSKQRTAANR